MEMSELDKYLNRTVPIPGTSVDTVLFKNWNNKKLIGFLKAYVDDGERPSW